MVFLPHTNTVILLEPYCGTMTEPGLPVIKARQGACSQAIERFHSRGQQLCKRMGTKEFFT